MYIYTYVMPRGDFNLPGQVCLFYIFHLNLSHTFRAFQTEQGLEPGKNFLVYTGLICETGVDSRPRRSDNLLVGGIAAPTCAVATRNEVLTTAKALETGAASGRIRFLRLLTRRLSLAEDPLQRTIFLAPMKRFLSGEKN
jgi:hypothetical protein